MKKFILVMLVAAVAGLVACNNQKAEDAEAKLKAYQDSIAEAARLDSIAQAEEAARIADSIAQANWADSVEKAAMAKANASVKKPTTEPKTTIQGRRQKVDDVKPSENNTIQGRR